MLTAKPTTRDELQDVINGLIVNNQEELCDLTDILNNADDATGAAAFLEDLEEYSVANILTSGGVRYDHPLQDLLGPLTIDELTGEGVLLQSEHRKQIELYAFLFVDTFGQLRAYVPTSGNAFNPETGKPYLEGGIIGGAPEGENNMDIYDDIAAQSFGFADYSDMRHKITEAWPYLYDKNLLTDDLTETIQVKTGKSGE